MFFFPLRMFYLYVLNYYEKRPLVKSKALFLLLIFILVAFHEWGNWSLCSKSCGPGASQRTRACVVPGGPACIGETTQNRSCVVAPCPGTLLNFSFL